MAYSKKEIEASKQIIIDGVSNGKSLKSILEQNDVLPSRPIVYQWFNQENDNYDESFLNNYARAREDSGDLDVEKGEKIIDDVMDGTLDPSAARVALDGIKWIAGIKKPKKYGVNSQLRITDNDNNPLKVNAIFAVDALKMPKDV